MGQSRYCFVFETHGSACADAERDNDWIWSEFWFIICMSSHAIMTITIPIAQNRIDSNSIMMSKIGFEIAKERWSSWSDERRLWIGIHNPLISRKANKPRLHHCLAKHADRILLSIELCLEVMKQMMGVVVWVQSSGKVTDRWTHGRYDAKVSLVVSMWIQARKRCLWSPAMASWQISCGSGEGTMGYTENQKKYKSLHHQKGIKKQSLTTIPVRKFFSQRGLWREIVGRKKVVWYYLIVLLLCWTFVSM